MAQQYYSRLTGQLTTQAYDTDRYGNLIQNRTASIGAVAAATGDTRTTVLPDGTSVPTAYWEALHGGSPQEQREAQYRVGEMTGRSIGGESQNLQPNNNLTPQQQKMVALAQAAAGAFLGTGVGPGASAVASGTHESVRTRTLKEYAEEQAQLRPNYYGDVGDKYSNTIALGLQAMGMAKAIDPSIQFGDTRYAASSEYAQASGIETMRQAYGGVVGESYTGTRRAQFYSGELQKLVSRPIEKASEYHYLGVATGVAVPANPWEYQADLAVEFLKGAPQKSSEQFSPVSGEMSQNLPGGRYGLQQWAWDTALNTDRPDKYAPAPTVSFAPAITALYAAEGKYGPYGGLYGGPNYQGTPSSDGIRKQPGFVFTEQARMGVLAAISVAERERGETPGLKYSAPGQNLVLTGRDLSPESITAYPEAAGLGRLVGSKTVAGNPVIVAEGAHAAELNAMTKGCSRKFGGATDAMAATAAMNSSFKKQKSVSDNQPTAFQAPTYPASSGSKGMAPSASADNRDIFSQFGSWFEGAKSDVARGISGITFPEQKPASLQENIQNNLRIGFAMVPSVALAVDYSAAALSGKPENAPGYTTAKSVAEFFAPESTTRKDYETSLATYQKDVVAFANWQSDYEARTAKYESAKSPSTFGSDSTKYSQLKAEYAAMDTTYNSLVARETALKQQQASLPQERSVFDKIGAVWESVNKETARYTTDVTGIGRYTGSIKVDESTTTGKAISFGKQFYAEQTQYPVELMATFGAGKALTIGEAGLKHGVASAAMSNRPVVGAAGKWLSGVGVEDTVKIGKAVFGGIIITDAVKNIIEQPTFEAKGGAAGRTVLQFAGFGAGAIKSGIATQENPNRMSSTLTRFTNWVNVEPENVHAGKSFVTGKPSLGPLSSVWEAGTVGFGQVELAARGKVSEARALGQAYEVFTAVRGTQPYNAKAKVNLWDLQEVPWEHKVVLDKYLGEEPHSLFGSGVQQAQGVPIEKVPAGQLGITPSSDIDFFANPKRFMQKLGATEGAVVRDWQGYEVPGRTGKWVNKIEGGYEQVPSRVSYGGAEFAVDIHGIPLEYPKLPGEVAGRPAQTGYKQEWQDLVSFKVLGDPFAVTPRSWQLTQIKDKTGKVVQVYEHADVQRYRLMDAFRKNLMTADSKNPAVARGGRFEKDTVRLLSAFEDAIQTERLGQGGFGKTTKLTDARAKDLIKTEQRLNALKDIEIRYRPGVSPEKAFLENTVSKAVESNTERQIPIWERAIRTEQSRLSLKNPKDAARYLQLVEAQKQITILKETPSAAKDIVSVKLGELQVIAGENLGYGMKMSGEPLETPVSLGNLKKLSEYDAPIIESPLKWSIRTKQPDYGHVNRKLAEMPMPEKTSTASSVDAWLKKTGQKAEPVSERSFRSSRDMARDIYDEFEVAAPAKPDRVITFRSPDLGARKMFAGVPMPSIVASPEPSKARSPVSPVGRYISPVKGMASPVVAAISAVGYSTGSPVKRAYSVMSAAAQASPVFSPVSRASPVFSPVSAPSPVSFPYSTPSPAASPVARSPFAPSPVKPPYMPAIGYDVPSPPGSPGPDKPYGPDFPPSPPPPDTPFLPGLPFGNLFGGGSGSSGGYRRGRSWINVHAVGAERLVETRWSMPEFRMPKMKGFRF